MAFLIQGSCSSGGTDRAWIWSIPRPLITSPHRNSVGLDRDSPASAAMVAPLALRACLQYGTSRAGAASGEVTTGATGGWHWPPAGARIAGHEALPRTLRHP